MHPTRIFKTPEDLEKAFEEYKEDLKKQSDDWELIQYVGKDGDKKSDGKKVPMTIEGFKRFCRKNYGCVDQYLKNQDNDYNDFLPICSYIKEEIRENQIIGGLLGFFNPSITQRLNGLKEYAETTSTNKIQILNIDPLDDSADNGTT
jgi:hypothetical protein